MVLGERRLVLARELTKTFETFLEGTALALLARMEDDPDQARGEFVVMVSGAESNGVDVPGSVEAEALLEALLAEGWVSSRPRPSRLACWAAARSPGTSGLRR